MYFIYDLKTSFDFVNLLRIRNNLRLYFYRLLKTLFENNIPKRTRMNCGDIRVEITILITKISLNNQFFK